MKKPVAILLMAGNGSRFGSSLPKQFHPLGGKKIYQHTLDVFLSSELFDEILLVCSSDMAEIIAKDTPNKVRIVIGGTTRQESSYLGLLACPDAHLVCIHDAVRPFVTKEILKENLAKAELFGAVDTCIASADTLVYAPKSSQISAIPFRDHYQRGQTPQTFQYPVILQAHLLALENKIENRSDDCSLVLDMGLDVHVAQGSEYNIKITTELDLCLAEQIFRLRCNSLSSTQSVSLKTKRYIVTGGTSGIGKTLCEQLMLEGALPIPLSRSSSFYTADLTCYGSTLEAFEKIQRDYGPVDGLINSMGKLTVKPLADLSHSDIESEIATNLNALIYCCKCVSLKTGGHIVNIASSSYARGRKDFTVYSSAKAAVVNFTQGFAEERPDLFINAVVPQRTHTAMRLQNFPEEDPDTLLDPSTVAIEIVSLLKQTQLTGSVIEIRKKLC